MPTNQPTKRGIRLKCGNCRYSWVYRGKYVDSLKKSKYYTTCPKCYYKVKLSKRKHGR